jgi:hypothetical protein
MNITATHLTLRTTSREGHPSIIDEISSAKASNRLPVSILAGPSANVLVEDIVFRDPKCRFGVLVSSNTYAQITHDTLVVERLVAANGGGDGPERIKAQIAAIAEKALVDH